ncbi:MAG: hypothetical protein KAQ95_09645 [Candidatus Heimdallarchaeota archaeon]|nr:hypothetical protein [Candidatus Heimdallarchaeota archaeon]
MISRLLAYLRIGGDANTATISRKLDIEEGTAIMLLDQLVKMGYLETVEPVEIDDSCPPSKCSGCGKFTACSTAPNVKFRLIK